MGGNRNKYSFRETSSAVKNTKNEKEKKNKKLTETNAINKREKANWLQGKHRSSFQILKNAFRRTF